MQRRARHLSRTARWIVAALVAAAVMPIVPVRAADRQKQVLVLYSTRRDAQIVSIGERDLPRILEDGIDEGVDYYSEYIDRARFPDPVYRSALYEFMRQKYQGVQFSIVIALNDLALEFVTSNRDQLFTNVPVVFFSTRASPVTVSGASGISSPQDYRGTIRLATALQPDVTQVFVITGAGTDDDAVEQLARAQFRTFEPRLRFEYLTGLPTKALEARLRSLPPHSIVYYLLVDRDGAGFYFHPLEYLNRVTEASSVPVYCWVDAAMDRGIVGGSLKDQTAQIGTLGALAVRVLRGERAGAIPIKRVDLNVTQVDWRQLRRWGISEARVPPGTIIRFRELSVWDRYGVYIVAAALVLFAQTLLIVGLTVQRTQRRQAEAQLRRNEAELRTSYERIRDLAARLLDAQERERARIARELHDDISQQMALLTIDLGLMNLAGRASDSAMAAALSRAESISKALHELSHRLHPSKLRLIGLVPALNGLQRELARADLSITIDHEQVPPGLPADVTLCLFRVVQEALHNALKYSAAKRVTVRLVGSWDGLSLTVADDGVGFDVGARLGSGLGLVSMEERVDAIGATLSIQSHPGRGTRLQVVVPVHRLAGEAAVSV